MGIITHVKFRNTLFGITFFSFLLLTASNPTTSTKSIFLNKTFNDAFGNDGNLEDSSTGESLRSNFRSGSEINEEKASGIQICTITAPPDVYAETDNDGFGNCSSTVSLGTPTVSNCGGISAKAFINGAEIDPITYLFPKGNTIVSWQITDGLSILASDDQGVEILDNEPTTITTKDITLFLDASGTATIFEDAVNDGSYDNCGGLVFDTDITSFDCSNLGANTVNLTVTDSNNNSDSATATVTVIDNTAPTVSTKDISVFLDASGTATISEDAVNDGSYDNCGGLVFDTDITSFDCSNVGANTVNLTVTDSNNNSDSATATVTLVDNSAPTIISPSDISNAKTSDDGVGNCTTQVSLGTPVATDNCGIASIKAYIGATEINPATYLFPVGTTTVTWQAFDNSNNTGSDTQLITVIDDEKPSITAPANVTAFTSDDNSGNCSTTAVLGLPLSADNCGSISFKTYINGIQIDHPNYLFPKGTTTVLWEVSDDYGNTNTDIQDVTILDDEAPIPPVLTNITRGCSFTVPTPDATDNCDTNVTVTPNRSTTFTTTGNITWTFTDENGNVSTASQTITIDPLKAVTSSTRTSVYGNNDGSASVSVSGGSAPYYYEWRATGSSTVLSTSTTATSLAAGNYEVTVIDAKNCTTVTSVTVISAVEPVILATSVCESVHDYIRTSTFQVDPDNIVGGIGDPQNYTYAWNFGTGATPSAGTGDQEFTVNWDTDGDKIVKLTITDESNYSQTFEIEHYVGGCFEGCGTSVNFDVNTDNFFIGDKDGNRLTGEDCEQTTEKYLWIDIIKNANGYGLSSEIYYAVNNGTETISRKAIGCFEEINDPSIPTYKPIPLGLFRLFRVEETGTSTDKITWKCGETFKVLQLNIRWTNENNWGCNKGTKPMCYGPSEEVIVNTPLMAEAIPGNILCFGDSTGSISMEASGGLAPYKYSISGPVNKPYQSTNVFYNLPAGTYTYYIKDSRDVITSGTVSITEPSYIMDATITQTQNINCYGDTGAAKIEVEGGTPPYSYSWNSGSTSDIASGLSAGNTYTATVTDANGCTLTRSISLAQPLQLTLANAGPLQSLGCGIRSTTLNANIPNTDEKGVWKIISGTGGAISNDKLNNPKAPFSGNLGETYILEWTISNAGDDTCPNSDQVTITFGEECSTLDFDGIDDHIKVGNFYDFPASDFSIEAWVRPKSVNGTKTILSKRNTGNFASGGYDLSIINGSLSFRWNGNQVLTIHKMGTDRWYHVAVIFRGSAPELFIDGINVPVQTGISNASNPNAINHPFMIGAAYYSSTPEKPKNYFHGWIEEVRIWKSALSIDQLRFMMNQRVEQSLNAAGDAVVKGEILPMNVPDDLLWSNLLGYYRLIVTEIDANLGTTPDIAANKAPGHLKNIVDSQENSAPLPYISANDGSWWNDNSWANPDYWDPPNSKGIDGTPIDWNIAYTSNNLDSGNQNITLLGLLVKGGKIDMLGTNPTSATQPGTGNALTVTTYLELDGFIDLNGESQLIQTEGSILAGSGRLDRDQQGTASSYNYNYFSSPVSTLGNSQNSGYTIAEVLKSGTDPTNPSEINYNYQYHFADGALTSPLRKSTYWLYKFYGGAGLYSEWHWVGKDGHLDAGEGFTMKGSSGNLGILDLQNYVFSGMPNNGKVSLNIGPNQNRLVGNPYPSAIDADEFIKDNLKDRRGDNIFNGSLYFWSHFSGKTHYLQRYVGGYATYNLAGGVRAVSNDTRINATGEVGGMEPKQYIPPGQAFFMNTVIDDNITNWDSKLPQPIGIVGGEIQFNNSQRVFKKEDPVQSVFHSKEKPRIGSNKSTMGNSEIEKPGSLRKKIWIKSKSPKGYYRQLLVTEDKACTYGIDLGYDAPLYDNLDEDMYWETNNSELVIQGIPEFNKDVELPLEIKVSLEGEFSLEIDKLENIPGDFAIHLKDTLKTQTYDLRKGAYTFRATPGIIKNRFSIIFLNEKSIEEAKTEENPALHDIELFYSINENAITILNPDLIPLKKAFIYTLNGKLLRIYDYIPTENKSKLIVPLKTTGIYILKLETEKGKKSIKFITH